jgi:hypothetical protein
MRAWILVGSLTAAVGATACGTTQAASPFGAGQTALRCEPGQHAVVNQSVVDGGTVTAVTCAADLPALGVSARPAYYAPAYQPAAARTNHVVVERKAKRSWQKRAVVIGGSSGAGAGLGALIGGSKGALIGAALGAGGGTVYELNKK